MNYKLKKLIETDPLGLLKDENHSHFQYWIRRTINRFLYMVGLK